MKKLMIAFAAVAMAAAANAAAINWNITGVTAPSSGSIGASYLLDGTKYSQFVLLDSAAAIATFIGTSGNTLSTGETKSTRTGTSVGGSATGYAASEKEDIFAVVFNNADVSKATLYAYTSAEQVTIPGSGDKTWSKGFDTETTGWTAIGGPEPTPEPTSAMLMLLGVAGLALRRKQK